MTDIRKESFMSRTIRILNKMNPLKKEKVQKETVGQIIFYSYPPDSDVEKIMGELEIPYDGIKSIPESELLMRKERGEMAAFFFRTDPHRQWMDALFNQLNDNVAKDFPADSQFIARCAGTLLTDRFKRLMEMMFKDGLRAAIEIKAREDKLTNKGVNYDSTKG